MKIKHRTDMTQEEKDLLLKDLCARLPYGVIVDYKENEFETPHWKITTIYPNTFDGWIGYDKKVGAGSESGSRPFNIGEVKPYLRPMSSMTEEEREFLNRMALENSLKCIEEEDPQKVFSLRVKRDVEELAYLYKHHYDVFGLIPAGLALSTDEFNPYKK